MALIPIVLLWEPMLGSIWGANVQILLFAAFVAAFWRRPARHDLHPEPRDLDAARRGHAADRLVRGDRRQRQGDPGPGLAGRGPTRPEAAVLGAVAWVMVMVLVTLPLVGFGLYVDWLGQLSRASDPTGRRWAPRS